VCSTLPADFDEQVFNRGTQMRFSVRRVASKWYHLAFVLGIGAVLCGCGAKVEQKKFNPTEGVAPSDIDKVKEFLTKAGIDGDVARIEDNTDFWRVEVTAKPKEGAKRRDALLGAQSYRVDKSTGKVTDEGPVGG
jgi:hypothetical protein